jgi:hypothetical protein
MGREVSVKGYNIQATACEQGIVRDLRQEVSIYKQLE